LSKILAIILAGGAGTRVSSLYNSDEPVKAMLKLGDERLIEKSLSTFNDIDIELAVLSFPSDKFSSLDKLVKKSGVKLLIQKAKQRKLPVMLELPYLLLWQYHFSKDSKFLKSFDHILTLPCDIILNSDDIKSVIDLHLEKRDKKGKQLSILSRDSKDGEYGTQFLMDGTRVLNTKSARDGVDEGWVKRTQAGVFLFSKELLKNPFPFFLFGAKSINSQMFFTKSDWLDLGIEENLISMRNK
jgi:NDP-sugar pyrophosphorylase family protein